MIAVPDKFWTVISRFAADGLTGNLPSIASIELPLYEIEATPLATVTRYERSASPALSGSHEKAFTTARYLPSGRNALA